MPCRKCGRTNHLAEMCKDPRARIYDEWKARIRGGSGSTSGLSRDDPSWGAPQSSRSQQTPITAEKSADGRSRRPYDEAPAPSAPSFGSIPDVNLNIKPPGKFTTFAHLSRTTPRDVVSRSMTQYPGTNLDSHCLYLYRHNHSIYRYNKYNSRSYSQTYHFRHGALNPTRP